MSGPTPGAVFDLLAAGNAHHRYIPTLPLFLDGREELHASDLHREFVVLFFVAEGAGHTAATRVYNLHLVARGQGQGGPGGFHPDQGLLVAMAVEQDLSGLGGEG